MAQYQAYLHSNRVNWLVFHHKMPKFHHEMSKFHHKCPNSIIIPCKFRFLDEKIKSEINQWDFSQHSQSHPKKTNFHLCLVLSTIYKPRSTYSLTPVLWPEIGIRWEENDLYKKSAAIASVPLVTRKVKF